MSPEDALIELSVIRHMLVDRQRLGLGTGLVDQETLDRIRELAVIVRDSGEYEWPIAEAIEAARDDGMSVESIAYLYDLPVDELLARFEIPR